ncbi:MAG TPA: zinc-binding alcohol dehydrogenase [Anaerolineaceae bacterium]|nr:zinc-binding alcohol dehydrogenase [Anaerolineaceae bacterium]
MKRTALYFVAPERVEIIEEEISAPQKNQVMVRTLVSAISPGTEMLFYRGHVPEELPMDVSIAALQGKKAVYPFKYGYASVGEVVEIGEDVAKTWIGERVFSFHPHESLYLADLSEVMIVPEEIPTGGAVFLPTMETAVNFTMDGHPIIGEAVAVFGLGIVGLMTTSLLSGFPLGILLTFDRYPFRRAEALNVGVDASLDPAEPDSAERAAAILKKAGWESGVDLTFELSGTPSALNQAIAVTGFDGRIVIGSWYGKKTAEIDLGGKFHRSRIRLISSQVSTVSPALSGRWDKQRRLKVSWEQILKIRPQRWVTHRFPFADAPKAYHLLEEHPEETLQILFDYPMGE